MTAAQLLCLLAKIPIGEKVYIEDQYGDPIEVKQLRRTDGHLIVCTQDYLDESWTRSRPDLAKQVIR